MNRRIALFLAIVLIIVAVPVVQTSAASLNPSSPLKVAQSTTKCTNTDFLTGVGKDFTDFTNTIKSTDMTSAASVAKALLSVADLRKKYEDMEDVKGCEDVQVSVFIAYANGTDVLALALAALVDTKNADTYNKAISTQLDRFGQTVNDVFVSAGVATPSAVATEQPTMNCKDADFLTGLGTDFSDLGKQIQATDMTDAASIAKTLLNASALRRKYEDMSFDTDECLYAQYDIITVYANASDLLALALAAQADPKNASTYTAAQSDQFTRLQNSIQNTLVDMGLATPAPEATMAATQGS